MQPQATQTPPAPTPPTTPAPGPEAPSPSPTPPPAAPEKKGYGKRPLWQWILIYVVLAAIVYAIIYFLWIHKSGTGGTGGY